MKRRRLFFSFALVWAMSPALLFGQEPPPPAAPEAPPPPSLPLPPPAPIPDPSIAPAFEEPAVVPTPRPRRSRRPARHLNDTVVIASNLLVAEGQTNGDTVLIAGKAEVLGTIRGDLTVVAGALHLGPKAEVTGDTVVIAGALDADPAAMLHGEQVIIGTGQFITGLPWAGEWLRDGIMTGRPLPPGAWWSWLVSAVALLVYLILGFLFPRSVQATVNSLAERPGASALAGALGLVAFGPLLLLLAVMVIGLPLIPVMVCLFLVSLIFGKMAIYRFVGQQAGMHSGLVLLQQPLVALIVGAVLFWLLYAVPIVGILAWGIAATLGLGAVLVTVFKRPHPPAAVPSGFIPPATSGGSSASLPRAGFWARFLASLLDLILVSLFVAMLFRKPTFFLPCWIVYHLALWGWRGTTLGGSVLGLKIVRVDGQPLTFPVAFVRLLGAFFSAAVLCLGFFWAGWSADKRSWHDKIAGTLVVKCPAGASLM